MHSPMKKERARNEWRGKEAVPRSTLDDLAKIAAVTAPFIGEGSITVATVTTTVPASGILGWLGFTSTVTSPVSLPVAVFVGGGALLAYGIYRLAR